LTLQVLQIVELVDGQDVLVVLGRRGDLLQLIQRLERDTNGEDVDAALLRDLGLF